MHPVLQSGAWEMHYIHRRWQRSKVLVKMRGTLFTALAWPMGGATNVNAVHARHAAAGAMGADVQGKCRCGPSLVG